MAFSSRNHDIEEWLGLETRNILQKVCNIRSDDGLLIGQYKTRVSVVPVGTYKKIGKASGTLETSAPSLFRSFSYDAAGNRLSSIPSMSEWTQACEDRSEGADAQIQNPFLSSGSGGGLPFSWDSFTVDRTDTLFDLYEYTLDAVPAGAVTITYTATDKCDLAGGSIVIL